MAYRQIIGPLKPLLDPLFNRLAWKICIPCFEAKRFTKQLMPSMSCRSLRSQLPSIPHLPYLPTEDVVEADSITPEVVVASSAQLSPQIHPASMDNVKFVVNPVIQLLLAGTEAIFNTALLLQPMR